MAERNRRMTQRWREREFTAVRTGTCRCCLDTNELLEASGRCSSCVVAGVRHRAQCEPNDDEDGSEGSPVLA